MGAVRHVTPIVFLFALYSSAAAEDVSTPGNSHQQAEIEIKTKKAADSAKVAVDNNAATLELFSPSGIGGATVSATGGKWPATVTLRFHFRGLVFFSVSNGKVTFSGSVLSHSGNKRLLYLTEGGTKKSLEKESPNWTEIEAFDSAGKPVDGLPGQDGYFQMTLPKALLEGGPKSLELSWIDFYRM
jgi:hypothetical protein